MAKRPIRMCVDRAITDPWDRQRLADLAAAENPANAPRADLVGRAMLSRLGIAFVTNSIWKNGRTLKVAFLGGTATQQTDARKAAAEVELYANLRFDFGAPAADSDIRIKFDAGDGAWSMVGTDALGVAKNQATMNLGFNQAGTYVHEFMHAVGAIHEHQHPEAGIRWNEAAVYAYYAGSPNFWDKATTKHNVLDTYSRTLTQHSTFDPKSIMLYPIDKRLTLDGFSVGWNGEMSDTDKAWLGKVYPKGGVVPPTDPPVKTVRIAVSAYVDLPAGAVVGVAGTVAGTCKRIQ